ncbi:MAG TPA: DUF374 domain-containing protein [Gammaproteobacteria bacterium]|nr:DUF374 domain-containing protein [Gammaproteobacteria bacterium]
MTAKLLNYIKKAAFNCLIKTVALLSHLHRYTCKIDHLTHSSIDGKLPKELIMIGWHEHILSCAIADLKQVDQALISSSKDGDALCTYLKYFGYKTFIRGSARHHKLRSIRNLLALKKSAKNIRLVITPDGPLGPARKIQAGLGALTKALNVPVIPTCSIVKKSWRLPTWDSHIIPKPFTYILIYYGEPINNLSDETLQKALEQCSQEAMALFQQKQASTSLD